MKVRGATAGDLAAVASCADLAFGVPRSPDNRVELAIQIQQGLVHVMCDAARVFGYTSFSKPRSSIRRGNCRAAGASRPGHRQSVVGIR